jgi:hypothetical protein
MSSVSNTFYHRLPKQTVGHDQLAVDGWRLAGDHPPTNRQPPTANRQPSTANHCYPSRPMNSLRTCVFPCAGFGTRFFPATKVIPKEMLPLVDKPILQYGIEEARDSGLDKLIIVTSKGKDSILDHFDRTAELERSLQERGKNDLLAEVDNVSRMNDLIPSRRKPSADTPF